MPDDPRRPEDFGRSTRGRTDHDSSMTPKDLKVQLEEQRLIVDWADGRRSEYALGELRRHCPCAECRKERVEQTDNPLTVLKSDPTNVRVTHARLVGSYAIRFQWSDGHDTGIFDFGYLRELDR